MEQQREIMQKLAGEVIGLPASEVPSQIICTSKYEDLARAITLRNAVYVLAKYIRGEAVHRTDAPWHTQYTGRSVELIAELQRTGYLDAELN